MKRVGEDGLNEFESRLVEIIYKHAKLKDSEEVARLKAQVEKLNHEILDYIETIEAANEMIDAANDEDDASIFSELEAIPLCEVCHHETDANQGYLCNNILGWCEGACGLKLPCKRWCVDVNKVIVPKCSMCKKTLLCGTCTVCRRCKP